MFIGGYLQKNREETGEEEKQKKVKNKIWMYGGTLQ